MCIHVYICVCSAVGVLLLGVSAVEQLCTGGAAGATQRRHSGHSGLMSDVCLSMEKGGRGSCVE